MDSPFPRFCSALGFSFARSILPAICVFHRRVRSLREPVERRSPGLLRMIARTRRSERAFVIPCTASQSRLAYRMQNAAPLDAISTGESPSSASSALCSSYCAAGRSISISPRCPPRETKKPPRCCVSITRITITTRFSVSRRREWNWISPPADAIQFLKRCPGWDQDSRFSTPSFFITRCSVIVIVITLTIVSHRWLARNAKRAARRRSGESQTVEIPRWRRLRWIRGKNKVKKKKMKKK